MIETIKRELKLKPEGELAMTKIDKGQVSEQKTELIISAIKYGLRPLLIGMVAGVLVLGIKASLIYSSYWKLDHSLVLRIEAAATADSPSLAMIELDKTLTELEANTLYLNSLEKFDETQRKWRNGFIVPADQTLLNVHEEVRIFQQSNAFVYC